MKDYELLGHPDAESAADSAGAAAVEGFQRPPESIDENADWLGRRCLVCRRPLYGDERKVHAGDCAHKREMQMQRERRRRQRR